MDRITYKGRKRLYIALVVFMAALAGLAVRVGYIMLTKADDYQPQADRKSVV